MHITHLAKSEKLKGRESVDIIRRITQYNNYGIAHNCEYIIKYLEMVVCYIIPYDVMTVWCCEVTGIYHNTLVHSNNTILR